MVEAPSRVRTASCWPSAQRARVRKDPGHPLHPDLRADTGQGSSCCHETFLKAGQERNRNKNRFRHHDIWYNPSGAGDELGAQNYNGKVLPTLLIALFTLDRVPLYYYYYYYFQGCICGSRKSPGQGSNRSCSCWPTPQPQKHRI